MTTEISHNINVSDFPRLQPNLFEVVNYNSQLDNSVDNQSQESEHGEFKDAHEQQTSKRNSIMEAEDTVGELDAHEIEMRQREANEETTKSEDLRKFLNEMHETFGKEATQTDLYNKDHQASSYRIQPNLNTSSNPGSPGGYNDSNSPYKQLINPYHDSDLEAMAAETAPMGPPDGGWAWFIVLASFFCMITIDGTCFNYGLLVPEMMKDFEESKIMAYMWPGSLISGFYMTLGPVASALSNQFNFRPVAMAGGLISGVAILLSTFMSNIVAFIFLFGMCGGVGFSLIYLPAIAVVGHWFHEKRPIAVGMALCGSGFGTLMFGQLIPWLIDIFTWRGTVILIAAVCIQSLVFIALFRPLELHLRLEQYSKILQSIKQIQKEENERKRQQVEKLAEEERRKKKAEKDQLRHQQRIKNKRIVIYRGSIMQKIIEEKKRQRTVSMGSLDGMVITRDNELVKVAMSSIDIYEKPILSVNAINKIRESVVKRLENKLKKNGPGGVVSIGDSRSAITPNSNISNAQIKNNLPQLVQEYINSQVSIHMMNSAGQANGTSLNNQSLQRQNSIQRSFPSGRSSFSKSYNSRRSSATSSINKNEDTASRTSSHGGLVLEEKAKAVIQASLRKELTRPFGQKELLFTGSMKQLCQENEMDKQSQTGSINMCNRSIHSQQSQMMMMNNNTDSSVHASSIHEYDGLGCGDGDFGMMDDGPNGTILGDDDDLEDGDLNGGINQQTGIFTNFMRELLDLSLLTSPTFLLMIISSITAMLGIFVPFFLLPVYLNSLNISLYVSGQLISYVGIANTAGRLISTVYIEKAWSSSHKLADCLWINNAALLLAGGAACSIPLLIDYYGLLIAVLVLYGLCVAAFVSLKSILVVELLGLNRLTNSFSFLLIFQGLATVFGPPLAGALCDLLDFKQYEFAFYFTGGVIILSGLLCFPLRIIARYERGDNYDNGLEQQPQRYSPVENVQDEEQSIGGRSFADIEPHCDDNRCDECHMDSGTGDKDTNNANEESDSTERTKPVETIEAVEDIPLEPLVEEEEEEEEEQLHEQKKNSVGQNDLFEVKRVED